MDDWTKAALTAFSGVLVGVILEPFRFMILAMLKRRNAKNLIYNNLADLVLRLKAYEMIFKEGQTELTDAAYGAVARFSPYIFYHLERTEPTAFYSLPEAGDIKRMYQQFAKWKEHNITEDLWELAALLNRLRISGAIDDKRLDRLVRALDKRKGEHTTAYLAKLFASQE